MFLPDHICFYDGACPIRPVFSSWFLRQTWGLHSSASLCCAQLLDRQQSSSSRLPHTEEAAMVHPTASLATFCSAPDIFPQESVSLEEALETCVPQTINASSTRLSPLLPASYPHPGHRTVDKGTVSDLLQSSCEQDELPRAGMLFVFVHIVILWTCLKPSTTRTSFLRRKSTENPQKQSMRWRKLM